MNKNKYDDTLSEELENAILDVNELFQKPLKCIDNESHTDNKRCNNDSVNNYLGFCKKHHIDLSNHISACKTMCAKLSNLTFVDKIHFMAYICEYILEYIDIFNSNDKFLESFINKFKIDFKTLRTKKDLHNYKEIINKFKDYKEQFEDILDIIKEEREEKEHSKGEKKEKKNKNPKKDKIDRLVLELKKHRKLFRGTYGRVIKATTKYFEILEDIVNIDPSYDGKSRFELSLDQIEDIKKESLQHPIVIKGTQHFIYGNELEESSTLRERVLLANYNHPNIVKVLFFHEGEKELVYPMINGGISLESYIKQTHLKERMKHFDYIFYQIINTVNYLHENGILHGDLKAKNILINKENHKITLIDFGACALEHTEGFCRTLCTYYVSSPEDLNSGKKNGKSGRPSDIWAIGMNMIHYLHGEDIIDLLEIDTEDLQDLFKRLRIENEGFDYPLPNEYKRKFQTGKPAKVKVEAKYRKIFLPLLYFDPSKRPTTKELLENPIFKSCKENKDEKKVEENVNIEFEEQLNDNKDETNTSIENLSLSNQEEKNIEKTNIEKNNEKKEDKKDEETFEQDSYLLIRTDLINWLYSVLKAFNALYCMSHVVRVLDEYVNELRKLNIGENKKGKHNESQFTIDELFRNKEVGKKIVCAVIILITSLLVQWRDIFTVEQLESILDIDNADDIISRISDVLTVLKYNIYKRTFDTQLNEVNYEKLCNVLKNDKVFSLTIEEQMKLYNE